MQNWSKLILTNGGKRLETVFYMRDSLKTLFKVEESFTERIARSKNFSRLEKLSSHGQFYSLSLSGHNTVWKKNFQVRKLQEKQYSSNRRVKDQHVYNDCFKHRTRAINEVTKLGGVP